MQWIFWLIAVSISAGAGYWVYRADRLRAVPYPWLTALLRSVVVLLTLLLLLVPVINITRNHTERPIVLLLQDNSSSIATALAKDSATYRKNVESLANKLSDKYRVVKWGFGRSIQNDSLFNYNQQATDISVALSNAQDFFGTQNLGAIILATDGRFNEGTNPLYQQLSLHSPVYTVAIGDSAEQKDIRIAQSYANKTVSLNSQFEIRADIIAALCKGYNNSVQLTEGGNSIATAPLNVNADRYDRSVSFTVTASKAGLHHYVISVPTAGGETNTANNRKDIFVEVEDEKKHILIASAAPHPDVSAIKEALANVESYQITVRTADNFPASLNDYQAVILHGLPDNHANIMHELEIAKKPMWFIIGSQTNTTMLNQLQHLATLQVSPSMTHSVVPATNTAFTLFTLPQNVQSVADKMPPLQVPLGSIKISPDASTLFFDKSGSTANSPLWSFQQGNVPVVMLTGNGFWRWRLYEFKNFGNHNTIDECIRQSVSFLCANSITHPFQVTLPKYIWSDQEGISLYAYLLNVNNEQINTPDASITITDSAGHEHTFSFERSGNAYKLNIGVWASGEYTYDAQTTYNGKLYKIAGSFVVSHMPLEQMQPGADYPLLYTLAKKYGGTLVPATHVAALYDSITHNMQIKPVIESTTDAEPLVNWKWYFFFILLVAVAEWLLRKYWMAQ